MQVHNQGVVLERDCTHVHITFLEQVRSPGVDNGHTLLLAAFDRVFLGQLRALFNTFSWQLSIRTNGLLHSEVDVSR